MDTSTFTEESPEIQIQQGYKTDGNRRRKENEKLGTGAKDGRGLRLLAGKGSAVGFVTQLRVRILQVRHVSSRSHNQDPIEQRTKHA